MSFTRMLGPAALILLSACSTRYVSCSMAQNQQAQPDPFATSQPVRPDEVSDAQRVVVVFLGDSLTAGYGLMLQQAFPALIQNMFAAEGYGEVEALNAGVSGDTTAGGLRRLDAVLEPNVRILVVGLGGNDALRGLTVAQTHDNLAAILDAALAKNVAVVLAGMEAPTNYGEDYQTAFRGTFTRLATEYRGRISFVPFLLEGVAGHSDLNQEDGIHPTAVGARMVAEMLYPKLRDLIDALPPHRS